MATGVPGRRWHGTRSAPASGAIPRRSPPRSWPSWSRSRRPRSGAHGPVASIGVGVPGLYDPATGATRFLVNVPGPWAGHAVAGPVGDALGVPVALVNDARAFGLAELRLGAGRGAALHGRPDPGDRGRRGHRHRRPRRPGPRRYGRRDRPPDDRPGRPMVRLRQPRLPRGVRPGGPASPSPAGRRRPRRRSSRPGPATRGPRPAWPRSAATWASASPTSITVGHPTGSSSAAGSRRAGELLLDRIRAELPAPSPDDVARGGQRRRRPSSGRGPGRSGRRSTAPRWRRRRPPSRPRGPRPTRRHRHWRPGRR